MSALLFALLAAACGIATAQLATDVLTPHVLCKETDLTCNKCSLYQKCITYTKPSFKGDCNTPGIVFPFKNICGFTFPYVAICTSSVCYSFSNVGPGWTASIKAACGDTVEVLLWANARTVGAIELPLDTIKNRTLDVLGLRPAPCPVNPTDPVVKIPAQEDDVSFGEPRSTNVAPVDFSLSPVETIVDFRKFYPVCLPYEPRLFCRFKFKLACNCMFMGCCEDYKEVLPRVCFDTKPCPAPLTDVYFLADVTGSMGSWIKAVQSTVSSIMTTVSATAPNTWYGAGQFRDFGDVPNPYQHQVGMTSTTALVTAAINTWSASGGGDWPEAWLRALFLSSSSVTGPAWRPTASKIIVLISDAPSHNPSGGTDMPTAIATLNAAFGTGIKVIAVNVGNMDATGQATAVSVSTGGSLITGATAATISSAIVNGIIAELQTTLTVSSSCADLGFTIEWQPTSLTVPLGKTACFDPILVAKCPHIIATGLKCTYSIFGGRGCAQTGTIVLP